MKITYLKIVVALFLLVSCEERGQKVNNVNYPSQTDDYNVRFLFEVDGIRVYKFYHGGEAVFFTNTNGKTEYTKSSTNGRYPTSKKVECICNKNRGEQWNITK